MAEEPATDGLSAAQIQSSLAAVAQFLREAHPLTPEAQQALADLLDELSKSLNCATASDAEGEQQEGHNATLLAAAKERLQETTLRAEVGAPTLTGIVERFLETLANIGV
jgi:hypothetical protein